MSKKKGGFDSPLKIIYLACETSIIAKRSEATNLDDGSLILS